MPTFKVGAEGERVVGVEVEVEKSSGKIILKGRYRIVQHLSSRPHLALYLGRRLAHDAKQLSSSHKHTPAYSAEPLVAIRELSLADFSPSIRAQIEAAAIEEFASPTVYNSSHLPSAGDRVWLEDDFLYLVLQLDEPFASPTSSSSLPDSHKEPVTLDTLLLDSLQWPIWVDGRTALAWGIQLCRMVARLHRQGVVLGNLNPRAILVPPYEGVYERDYASLPILLPCWPPAPCYWQGNSESRTYQLFAAHDYATTFPIGRSGRDDSFAAPEMLYESRAEVTERSDVYSLGATLYLLLTHYAPICAASRISSQQYISSPTFETPRGGTLLRPPTYSLSMPTVQGTRTRTRFERRQTEYSRLMRGTRMYHVYDEPSSAEQGLELLDPRALNSNVPVQLTEIVLCALELEPDKRFASAFAMVEALEAIDR